jgi:hypothetical protein
MGWRAGPYQRERLCGTVRIEGTVRIGKDAIFREFVGWAQHNLLSVQSNPL